ncbi:hypothetical protein ADK67_42300 [Saccharothrix sp. NRRL B-16348]|nr:hypothetical protein ADK67_42300 [Saccharothrix sp. NRRL B-16348]
MVCLPPAGGNAGTFAEVVSGLPAWIDVRAVQLPGRQERSGEPPVRRLGQLLPALAAELDVGPPLVLLGNSLGATVAFELVRRLERQARVRPARLIVSSARAPHVAGRLPAYSAMSDARFVAELIGLGALPAEAADHPELLTALLPAFRADFELGETYRYRPGPPVRCPIDAVTGADDAHVPFHLASAWGELTCGEFTDTVVPGGHDMLRGGVDGLRAAVVRGCAKAAGVPA